MSLDIILQTGINGLFLGGTYALFAVGLTLIYGVMYMINFAHGEFMMIGMYLAYWIFVLLGINPYASVFVIALIVLFMGMMIEKILFEKVLDAPLLNQILLSLGVSILLIGLVQFFWGAEPRSLSLPISGKSIRAGELVFNYPRSIALLSALGLCLGVFFFLSKTKLGLAIRACSQSRFAASLMGIKVERINMVTYGIGTAMVGVAGALLSPSIPMSPTVGQNFGISAFVVVVMGTLGNTMGAFVAAIIIGLAEAFGGIFLGPQLRQLVSLVVFILVLLLKPQGLFGRSTS